MVLIRTSVSAALPGKSSTWWRMAQTALSKSCSPNEDDVSSSLSIPGTGRVLVQCSNRRTGSGAYFETFVSSPLTAGKLKPQAHSGQDRRTPVLQRIAGISGEGHNVTPIQQVLGGDVACQSVPELAPGKQAHHVERPEPQLVLIVVELHAGVTALYAQHQLGWVPVAQFERSLMPRHLGDIEPDEVGRGFHHNGVGVLISPVNLEMAGEAEATVKFRADRTRAPQVLPLARDESRSGGNGDIGDRVYDVRPEQCLTDFHPSVRGRLAGSRLGSGCALGTEKRVCLRERIP